MAIARAGIEQGVAGEQRRLVRMGEQADMRHRVPGRIEALQFDAAADADGVAVVQADIDAADQRRGRGMREDPRAGGGAQRLIARGVVAMMMRVEDLRDLPAVRRARVCSCAASSGSMASASPVSSHTTR